MNHNPESCKYIDLDDEGFSMYREVHLGHKEPHLKPIHIPADRDGVVV